MVNNRELQRRKAIDKLNEQLISIIKKANAGQAGMDFLYILLNR
jgi:hypothetical protein